MKNNKLLFTIILLVLLSIAFSACRMSHTASEEGTITETTSSADLAVLAESSSDTDTSADAETTGVEIQNVDTSAKAEEVASADDTQDVATVDLENIAATITLMGESATVEGSGVTVDGAIVTVASAGVYSINGMLTNGQILVDTDDDGDVVLLLNGVDIAYASGAPIFISNADNAVITLADGTDNSVTDGVNYVFPDAETDEPNAAIFSDDDLEINGAGSLTVEGNYNHGIFGKDDVIIASNITVSAVNDGIKGRDSLVIQSGLITINAGGDGLQSNNDEDAEKGFVSIEGGTLNITAAEDAIQAETVLTVGDGNLTLSSGGGSGYSAADSAKGLKAGVNLVINGGNITIDSADDAIHSNGEMTIGNATMQLASGDDGIHADASIRIDSGELNITQSYEGIESAIIVINGGTMHVVASDDGINVAGGADGSAVNGRPGQNRFADLSSYYLHINGGYIFVDATGDGIDANGSVEMSGGMVLVNGPTASNNGALDADGGFSITGGYLVAVGSAGMAQGPSATTTQNSVLYNFSSVQSAGTIVHIQDESGNDMLTFTPLRDYQSIVLSSPNLQDGTTYTVYVGGSADGSNTDGLYTDGVYSAGSAVESFTLSGAVTSAGVEGRGFGGGPGRRGSGDAGRP